MKLTALTIAAGIGLIIGAGSLQVLHAQMKPPAYQIGIINVRDEEGYKKLVPDVRTRITELGGKILATAGAAGVGKVTSLTGGKANRIVITEWPSEEAATKWWATTGEKDIKALGQHGTLDLYLVEGLAK